MSIPRLNTGFIRGTAEPDEEGLVISSPYLTGNRQNLEPSELNGQAEVLGAVYFDATTPGDRDFDASTCQGGSYLPLFQDSKWKSVFGTARPTKFGFTVGNANFALPIQLDMRLDGLTIGSGFLQGTWLDDATGASGVIAQKTAPSAGLQALSTGLTTGSGRLQLFLELTNYARFDVSV